MQAGDDEKELMQNEEENPINKKKKKSLGSIKYKVSFLGMNSASDLWQYDTLKMQQCNVLMKFVITC